MDCSPSFGLEVHACMIDWQTSLQNSSLEQCTSHWCKVEVGFYVV